MGMDYDHAEVTNLEALNRLAPDRGWKVRGDGASRYYLPEMADIDAIWRANAGTGIPYRNSMTARLLQRYLTIVMLHECVPGPGGSRRYRTRIMGGETAEEVGEGSGRFYDEFLPAAALPMWNAMSDATLAHGGPVRFILGGRKLDSTVVAGEIFSGPLLTDDGRADLILSAGRFNAAWQWDAILSHWQEDVAVPA